MTIVHAAWLAGPLIVVCGVWFAAACPRRHHRHGRHTMKSVGIAAEISAVIADMNRHTRERSREEAGSDVATGRRGGRGGRHSVSVVPSGTY